MSVSFRKVEVSRKGQSLKKSRLLRKTLQPMVIRDLGSGKKGGTRGKGKKKTEKGERDVNSRGPDFRD